MREIRYYRGEELAFATCENILRKERKKQRDRERERQRETDREIETQRESGSGLEQPDTFVGEAVRSLPAIL